MLLERRDSRPSLGGLQSHVTLEKLTPRPASYQQCDFKEAGFPLCS